MDKGISFFSNVVYSLFIHTVLLAFLLTLPVYNEESGNKSLLGYFVYLAGGEDNQMKPSTGDGVSKKQVAVAQGRQQTILPEKVIDETGAEEKKVPPGESLTDKRNEDISSEFTEQGKSLDKEKDEMEMPEMVATDKTSDKRELTPEKPVLAEQALSIKEERKSSPISSSEENIVKPEAQEGSADKIPASPIRKDEAAEIKTETKIPEIPKVIDSASTANMTVLRETPEQKKIQEGPEPEVSSEKADGISLRRTFEDNNQEVLPELPPKTEKAPEVTAKAKKSGSPRVVGGASKPLAVPEKGDAVKNLRKKGTVRKKMRKNSGLKIPGPERENKLILPDIEDIIKGIPFEPYVNTEIALGMKGEAKLSESPRVTGETDGSLIGAEKAGSVAGNEKRTEKEEKAVDEPNAEAGKSSIDLSLDKSLFYRDIKIEVLLKDMDNTRVRMYLLKNSYSSLRKRHRWGPEKEIGTSIQTIQGSSADKEIKRVQSVAKAAEGIYTFVIDNKDVNAFETEVLFTLYGGQNRERDKTYKAVSVPPSSVKQFRFVLPDAVFWDDENHFTGNIEDSDSISKFNDESGFLWREEKEY